MHYYQFNIGDYATHTRHLSPMEDLAYRRLLDLYYLHEQPIPLDPVKAARLVMLNDRSTDVEQVLNEFFTRTENGWINARADVEIDKYKNKKIQQSDAGKKSAESRKANKDAEPEKKQRKRNVRSTDVQPNKNQEPLTNNQLNTLTALGVSEQTAIDFLKVRKAKRAPLTETALDNLRVEASKANLSLQEALSICCKRNWQGFEASWLKEKPGHGKPGRLADTLDKLTGGNHGTAIALG